jgi:hypothetical protein
MLKDIKYLLNDTQEQDDVEAVYLWDNLKDHVEYGISYGKHENDEVEE